MAQETPVKKKTRLQFLKEGFYSGFGWSMGVTVGFAAVSTILVFVLGQLGGLPLIGGAIANIVSATQEQLSTRSVFNKPSKTPTPTQTPFPTQTPQPTEAPTATITLSPTSLPSD